MATKLRREKDIISRVTSDYQTAATVDYQRYLEGSPVYVTYYQFYAPGSTYDNSLETVHSLTSSNSPNKYKVIEDFPLYGMDQLDVENALTERGLESLINSSLIVLPQTVIPTSSDFIAFDVEGMERELFQIVNVDFDRVHPNKFYKIEITLYKENVDEIFENCITTRYTYDESDNNGLASGNGSEDGNIGGSIIPLDQKELKDNTENLFDAMLDQYQKMFYDSDMDQFVYRSYDENCKPICFWSPYLQKFFYETKLLKWYNQEVMTEFYVRDINSWDFGEKVFNDYCWDNCIYKSVLTEENIFSGETITEPEKLFYSVSGYDLDHFKVLPFFCSSYTYKMLNFDLGWKIFWEDDISKFKEKCPFLDYPISTSPQLFISEPYSLEKVFVKNNSGEFEKYLVAFAEKDSDCIKTDKNGNKYIENRINSLYFYTQDEKTFKPIENSLKIVEGSEEKILQPSYFLENDNPIIKNAFRVLSGEFILNTETIKELNEVSYRRTISNFFLIPIILYGIKNKISQLATS